MSALNLYKSYNFIDKDPVIDVMRNCLSDQHVAYARLAHLSGVSESTLRNWFDGKTRKPQFCTVAAVMGALGYRMHWQLEAPRPRPKAQPKQIEPDRQLAAIDHIKGKLRALEAPASA